MGTKQRDNGEDGALAVLEERLEDPPDDHDDLWETFAERTAERDDFYRGGSVDDNAAEQSTVTDSTGNGRADNGMSHDDRPDPSDSSAHLDLTETDDGLFEEGKSDTIGASQESVQDEAIDELIDRDDERLDPDDDVRRVRDDAQEFVVPKGDYCEQCPHYSDPPDVGCTNSGTEIIEFEDMEHVRVRNCPVVNDNPLAPDSA